MAARFWSMRRLTGSSLKGMAHLAYAFAKVGVRSQTELLCDLALSGFHYRQIEGDP
jgi:hypothetical protein